MQYLGALSQAWRAEAERNRKEIAILNVLMMELGEAMIRLKANVGLLRNGSPPALEELRDAPVGAWDALRLQMGEFWMPKDVFNVGLTYQQIALINDVINRRGNRMKQEEFHKVVDGAVADIGKEIKLLERRALKVGRE